MDRSAPRPLTAEVRRRVGLPPIDRRPYNWPLALFCTAIACAPLAIGRYWTACALVALVALGLLPALRRHDRRGAEAREDLYLFGTEVVGRVLDVEPGTRTPRDRVKPSGLVRVEFLVGVERVVASVFDSPLTRRGLDHGDDVVLVYDPSDPLRCLVIEKIAREARPRKPRPAPPP